MFCLAKNLLSVNKISQKMQFGENKKGKITIFKT